MGSLETTAEDLSCAAIGFAYPRRIDPKRGGTATTMTEPASDGTQVDASGEQLGRGVVPESVQMAINAKFGAHVAVAMGDSTGIVRAIVSRRVRKKKRLIRWLHRNLLSHGLVALPVFSEHLDGRRVQGDPTHLVRLGVLLD